VPPFPFRHVRKTIEGDFGCPLESIFSEFNLMPVASGSVAQVHRAALLEAPPGSPRIVAVKVPPTGNCPSRVSRRGDSVLRCARDFADPHRAADLTDRCGKPVLRRG
jgi:hypothetical protein